MSNPYKALQTNPTGLIRNWVEVTPNDNQDNVGEGNVAIGLYVSTSGNVTWVDVDGNENTASVPHNFYLTGSVARVKSTNTTASGIFALISA